MEGRNSTQKSFSPQSHLISNSQTEKVQSGRDESEDAIFRTRHTHVGNEVEILRDPSGDKGINIRRNELRLLQ